MKTYINGVYNENAQWVVLDGNQSGELVIDTTATGETLAELEETYSVAGIVIERKDDEDNLIDEWHIKNLITLAYTRKGDGAYEVRLTFDASRFSAQDAEAIAESLDDSEMSILEVAGYCATIEESVENHETILGELRTNNENRCNTTDERGNALMAEITHLSGMVNAFADRIARLENAQ